MRTITKVKVYEADLPAVPLRAQLRRRLLTLNYHAFVQALCVLLRTLGYEEVQPGGRTKWKGRNRNGGVDIEAFLPAGLGARKVIVQAKQFDTLPLFQRSVDELRGTCLRTRAAEALLITLSTFSPVVQQRAPGGQTPGQDTFVAPVRLLDGDALLDLLLRRRIGIREAHTVAGQPPHLEIDDAFFDDLSTRFAGTRRRTVSSHSPSSLPSRWRVMIKVGLPGKKDPDNQTQGKERA